MPGQQIPQSVQLNAASRRRTARSFRCGLGATVPTRPSRRWPMPRQRASRAGAMPDAATSASSPPAPRARLAAAQRGLFLPRVQIGDQIHLGPSYSNRLTATAVPSRGNGANMWFAAALYRGRRESTRSPGVSGGANARGSRDTRSSRNLDANDCPLRPARDPRRGSGADRALAARATLLSGRRQRFQVARVRRHRLCIGVRPPACPRGQLRFAWFIDTA